MKLLDSVSTLFLAVLVLSLSQPTCVFSQKNASQSMECCISLLIVGKRGKNDKIPFLF